MNHLRILSAGAGAGKTYSLSQAIVEAITSGVPAQRIMATTFTTKAAKELTERVRQRLLAAGKTHEATLFLDGYVGTMNSVFGRLLREFALPMGLSPEQAVLPEEQARVLFQTVVAKVIDDYYERYQLVFNRLQMTQWRDTVHEIINKARQNGMNSEAVRDCGAASWQMLQNEVLPSAQGDGDRLDAALRHALLAIKDAVSPADTTKKTKTALDTLLKVSSDWNHRGYLYWQEWVQVSKASPAKKSEDDFAFVLQAAAVHERHPQLHRDLADAITALFHAAADAMDMYAKEKAKRGLVDFTDQEALALVLLSDKSCAAALQDRISHVFVDEFQDSSPLQLALITRLLDLAEESTWVGDVKQAIFGFRGTDPSLMTAAMEHIDEANIRVLGDSYRSRASLVDFVNSVFVPVFSTIGLKPEQTRLTAKRVDRPGQGHSLETWIYQAAKNRDEDLLCLARGVKDMLGRKDDYLVEDSVTGELHPIRPSDIAILCRSNDECQRLADALYAQGIRATVGKGGLMSTPEAVVAMAAFRYLIDDGDTLALALLIHYSAEAWGHGRFLERWLEVEDPRFEFGFLPHVSGLDAIRKRMTHMSPSEVWDLAISAASIPRLALEWGDGDKRMANLEALRALAVQYEDACAVNGLAATSSGLLLFLRDIEESDSDLNRVADSYDVNAVHVSTYHKAKGLEWPVVILSSLQSSFARSGPPLVFNQAMATTQENTVFDVMNPLNGRNLIYWPWPYGGQRTGVGLDARVDALPLLNSAKRQALLENIRLMYVGMTRARDYLIFATRNPSQAHWLDELKDEYGANAITILDGGVGADASLEGTMAGAAHGGETHASGTVQSAGLPVHEGRIRTKEKAFACVVRNLGIENDVDKGVGLDADSAMGAAEPGTESLDSAMGATGSALANFEQGAQGGSEHARLGSVGTFVGRRPHDTGAGAVELAAYVAPVKQGGTTQFPPAHFQPSKAAEMLSQIADFAGSKGVYDDDYATLPFSTFSAAKVIQIGGRIPITGHVEMSLLGDMVHAFLAADNVASPKESRLRLAEQIRESFGVHAITADSMLDAADRLTQFVVKRYPDVQAVHKEWPMHIRIGNVKAAGWMDLILDTETGWIVIDHKTFPGQASTWEDKAKSYIPQLQVYASALEAATGKTVREVWVHMPIVGAMIGFDEQDNRRKQDLADG